MTKRRKANTAMVFNPAGRSLTINGSRRRTAKRRTTKRRNPVTAVARRRSNPVARRRSNPATVTGLLVTAVMAGIGVSLFDQVTSRLVPQSSAVIRAGVKLGGAWLFQSPLGAKVPVLGKYKNDIALVLAVFGVVDLMNLYVLPVVAGAVSSIGGGSLIAAPDDSTAGVYGAQGVPVWS